MNKFHVQANQIGLIAIEIDKKVYTKRGVELIHHDIFFTVFDNNLKSLGMIFERELRD
ncbi:MAG TPA: hypothetical protein VE912_09210 [Bacteroidales bacterium]|nr:hypothetical protein [Bacteroidales bacterium]